MPIKANVRGGGMKQVRNLSMSVVVVLLSGCISYPATKILVTPIGAAGIHSFAPSERNPDEMKAARETSGRLAHMAKEDRTTQR
jgi:hypothetical protein